MPVPVTSEQLAELVRKSHLIEPARLDAFLARLPSRSLPVADLAQRMVAEGLITNFQSEQLLQGKWRGFTIGKYKVLERLGAGGMGSVYLCEHQKMKHKVAVKVLPTAKASDPAALGRFYREARAAGLLDHPHLVRAHDIDQEGELHYLVMDYIDGVNLQHLVARSAGPLPWVRACHYIYQACLGLQHAFEQGLVHRDIKPANLLLDRQGIVRILDMGLARFYEDNQDMLTINYDDNNVLGTADYVSPEQAIDSHGVDIRTDIYSLGATFYFLLTGRPLFPEGKVAQKLIWQQKREPDPIAQLRPDLPTEVVHIVERMIAKDRTRRFQAPADVVAELEPFVQTPIDPPGESEIPLLSPAARSGNESSSGNKTPQRLYPGSSGHRQASSRPPTPRHPMAFTVPPPVPMSEPAPAQEPIREVPAPRREPIPPRPRQFLSARRLTRVIALFLVSVCVGTSAGFTLHWALIAQPGCQHPSCPGPRLLVVDRSGRSCTFGSILEALKEARPGDSVQVCAGTWDEVLRLDSGRTLGQGVILEGVGDEGRPVVWQAPTGVKELASLIHISAVPGLRLRNFVLDGRDVTQHLITISGPCPGLVLEDLTVRGFRECGVRLTSGVGEGLSPLLLRRLQITPSNEAEAGVILEAYPDQPCRHVQLNECQFQGPCRVGVLVVGPVAALELSGCRLHELRQGVLHRKGTGPAPIQLVLSGNEFQNIRETGLHFEAPPAEGSVVRLVGNRFEQVRTLARTEGFQSEPRRTPAAWIWGPEASSGRLHFRKRFTLEAAPGRAVLSLTADPSCVIWLNGQRVGQTSFSETTRQIAAFDVARFLHAGENVLAVEVPGGTRAGVLAELTDNSSGPLSRTLVSDSTWKVAATTSTGWQSVGLDDRSWDDARVLTPYGVGEPLWRGLHWEAVIQEQFRYQAGRVFPPPSGNERDASSQEGFPSFEAAVRPR